MALYLHDVVPSQGMAWARNGFRTFFRRPMAFTSLFLAFMIVTLLAGVLLPFVGSVLAIVTLPLLSLGYMIATRSALADGPVHPGQLVEPLRAADAANKARRRTLLMLCGAYAAVMLAIVWLGSSIDGGRMGRFQALMMGGAQDEATRKELEALMADPALFSGMLVFVVSTAILSIPFWHAPALVWWGRQGMAQSLFSSTLAVWRTKGAFLTYSLAWVAVVGAFGLLTAVIFTLLGAPQMAGLAALPAALMFTCVFYVSLYFSFTDTFGTPD
jgi:uncharacterized MnhB-related membrane protein